jgi:Zonular occludens toxin (Zot)
MDEIKLWRSNQLWYCNFYFWRKGGGKTQQAVIDAYEAYRQGKIVISNIWLSFPHIRFMKWGDLPPILKEIADYCNYEKLPIEAPMVMLKAYWLERKKWTVQEFFLLFDEIGQHLNTRNWNKNFKSEFMRDMLTEPRKYWLTIVGITQAWKRVDVEFREACEDWFLFGKQWKWIFQRTSCTHLWVHDWEFDYDKPIILWVKRKFTYFDKLIHEYRKMYYTGEISWDGAYHAVPHRFVSGGIYVAPSIQTLSPAPTIEGDSPKPEGSKNNNPRPERRWRPKKNVDQKQK